jgi:hypothetical protein
MNAAPAVPVFLGIAPLQVDAATWARLRGEVATIPFGVRHGVATSQLLKVGVGVLIVLGMLHGLCSWLRRGRLVWRGIVIVAVVIVRV